MSKDKSKKKQVKEVDESELQDDYLIKPSNKTPKLDTSDWPLLLKVSLSSKCLFLSLLELRPSPHQNQPLHSHSSRIHSFKETH